MIYFERTDSSHSDFINLIAELDAYLARIDGEDHAFYSLFNQTTHIKHVVLAYRNSHPIGCGAFKVLENDCVEIKRMFVKLNERGKQVASQILKALEQWAQEIGFTLARLETGQRQQDAVRLYKKNGYQLILNYGQYIGVQNSICFEKSLDTGNQILM